MNITLKGLCIENFKSYVEEQWIDLASLNVLLGANSSGKSTALQTLLALKQTMECNSPDIDLLLSGKYVSLGDFQDVVNDSSRDSFKFGVSLDYQSEVHESNANTKICWNFAQDKSDAFNNAELESIQIQNDIINIIFRRTKERRYRVIINSNPTDLYVRISNLRFMGFELEYDSEFNLLFQSLLNDLLNAFLEDSKFKQIARNKMISLSGIDDFYYMLFDKVGFSLKTEGEENLIAQRVVNLIRDYAKFQFWDYIDSNVIPNEIREGIIEKLLTNKNEQHLQKISDLLDLYAKQLSNYKQNVNSSENRKTEFSKFDYYKYIYRVDAGKECDENDINKVFTYLKLYEDMIKEIFSNIFYVGPIREKPLGLYNIGFEAIPKYVGPTGAYFASVLLRENKPEQYILPDGSNESITLWDALNEWSVHLSIANEIQVTQNNSFGFSVSIENLQQKKADIMNVGIGTSQVLPVLVAGLVSEKGETLIFEQPELHLHPYSQSRLADFFVMLAKNGRRIIVETHSESMLLRLRYHLLKEHLLEEQISVNFFKNTRGTKVKSARMNSYGGIEYPEDFKDETQELISCLLAAAAQKGK